MKIENWKLKIENWKLRTENWKLKIENWKLKIENWKLKSEKWKVKIENWKLKIENWKLKIENWKLKIENWKLKIENWKLKIKNWKLKIKNWKLKFFQCKPTILVTNLFYNIFHKTLFEIIKFFQFLNVLHELSIINALCSSLDLDFKNRYWNDRRSRRVFFCFYSAISQLTSAKFQTFAYNSRTVWSSYMKFWQQFEINELCVCTKFRGNRLRDFGFRTRKPRRKFGIKSGLSQKWLKYGKKIFHMVVCLKMPFHPNQPTFGRDEVFLLFFLFFSFFFFLIFVRSSFPKPQTIEI